MFIHEQKTVYMALAVVFKLCANSHAECNLEIWTCRLLETFFQKLFIFWVCLAIAYPY